MFRLVLTLAFAAALSAQTAFEVAVIKPSPKNTQGMRDPFEGGPGTRDPGRWRTLGATVRGLVIRAYGLKPWAYAGPQWTDEARFDIETRLSPQTTPGEFRVMLQALLTERFKLTFHREHREVPAYDLVAAKSGAKLARPVAALAKTDLGGMKMDSQGYPIVPSDISVVMIRGKHRMQYAHATMAQFAAALTSQVDRPVLDRTGLAGEFAISLHWADADRQAANGVEEPVDLSIYEALQKQLGLKLESTKRRVEVLVVDGASRTPISN